jgi:hypothetical protein
MRRASKMSLLPWLAPIALIDLGGRRAEPGVALEPTLLGHGEDLAQCVELLDDDLHRLLELLESLLVRIWTFRRLASLCRDRGAEADHRQGGQCRPQDPTHVSSS